MKPEDLETALGDARLTLRLPDSPHYAIRMAEALITLADERPAPPHVHSYPLSHGICSCGDAHPMLSPRGYGPPRAPDGFAADSDPPYGHDCGPECTHFGSPLSERDEYERTVLGMITQMPGKTFIDLLCRNCVYLTAMWNFEHPVVAEEVKDDDASTTATVASSDLLLRRRRQDEDRGGS